MFLLIIFLVIFLIILILKSNFHDVFILIKYCSAFRTSTKNLFNYSRILITNFFFLLLKLIFPFHLYCYFNPDNIILYKTNKQSWLIQKIPYLKKRISQNVFNNLKMNSLIISFKDSKLINKKVRFNILSNKIEYFDKTIKKIISPLPITINNTKSPTLCIKNKKLDQFYTTLDNADLCTQIYNKHIKVNKRLDFIIEPSAGNGSFINNLNNICNNVLYIDIDPKHNFIQKVNFLDLNLELNKYRKIHIVGNPPFTYVKDFIKKSTELANCIGFILPLSFRKTSIKKIFPLNFHCIYEHILSNSKFYHNNSLKLVPTVFQIWEKKNYLRDPIKKIESKYIKFVQKKDNPDIAFQRVGSNAGKINFQIHTTNPNSHYYIKLINNFTINQFIKAYTEIKFFHKNTVGPKSISQSEFLLEFTKLVN